MFALRDGDHVRLNRYNIPWVHLFLIFGVIAIVFLLGDARGAVLFSALLAALFAPLVRSLERRGWRRDLAVFFVLFAVVGPLLLIFIGIVSVLVDEITHFVQTFPETAATAYSKLQAFAASWGYELPHKKEELIQLLTEQIQNLSFDMLKSVSTLVKNSVLNFSSAVLAALNFILIPVFFFYVLADYEKWKKNFWEILPMEMRPFARRIVVRSEFIFGSFLRGQLVVCLILAAMYGVGLQLTGLQFGWLIGILTGLFNFIPYLGFGTGILLSILVILATGASGGTILGVTAVLMIVQTLESFVITPRLVGQYVGLTPLEAIIALIVAGNLMGFLGLLLAIPIGAMVKEIIVDGVPRSVTHDRSRERLKK